MDLPAARKMFTFWSLNGPDGIAVQLSCLAKQLQSEFKLVNVKAVSEFVKCPYT